MFNYFPVSRVDSTVSSCLPAALPAQHNIHSFLVVSKSKFISVDESSSSECEPVDGHKRSKACGERFHETCWRFDDEWAVSVGSCWALWCNCRVSLNNLKLHSKT